MIEEYSVAKTYDDVRKLFEVKQVDYEMDEVECDLYERETGAFTHAHIKRITVYTDGSGEQSACGVFEFDKNDNLCRFNFSLCSWQCDVDAIAYYDYPPCFVFLNKGVKIGTLCPNFLDDEDDENDW